MKYYNGLNLIFKDNFDDCPYYKEFEVNGIKYRLERLSKQYGGIRLYKKDGDFVKMSIISHESLQDDSVFNLWLHSVLTGEQFYKEKFYK